MSLSYDAVHEWLHKLGWLPQRASIAHPPRDRLGVQRVASYPIYSVKVPQNVEMLDCKGLELLVGKGFIVGTRDASRNAFEGETWQSVQDIRFLSLDIMGTSPRGVVEIAHINTHGYLEPPQNPKTLLQIAYHGNALRYLAAPQIINS
jgi:hypothetical protein